LSYVSSLATIPLIPETIGQKLDHTADTVGDKEAFIFSPTNERLTFTELRKTVFQAPL
jgi:hypothetical protein